MYKKRLYSGKNRANIIKLSSAINVKTVFPLLYISSADKYRCDQNILSFGIIDFCLSRYLISHR